MRFELRSLPSEISVGHVTAEPRILVAPAIYNVAVCLE